MVSYRALIDRYPETAAFDGDLRNLVYRAWQILGLPEPTDIQYDVAQFLQRGPDMSRWPHEAPNNRVMVQGFRGLAKSTLTSTLICWEWLCDIDAPVLSVSATYDDAATMSQLVLALLDGVPELRHLAPSREQRSSVKAFDVAGRHPSKAPSLKSVGVSGGLVGSRGKMIVADDLETESKAYTQGGRDRIEAARKQLDSIVLPGGRLVLLGTPQTELSVYVDLPKKGFSVRVWPARYPPLDQINRYASGELAPTAAAPSVEGGAQDRRTAPPGDDRLPRGGTALGEDVPASRDLVNPAGQPLGLDSLGSPLLGEGLVVVPPEPFQSGCRRLAPLILQRLLDDPSLAGGSLSARFPGQPTEPGRFNDDDLLRRELSIGASTFALQFLLDTTLSDADRYPLKLADLVVMDLDLETAPDKVSWGGGPDLEIRDLPLTGLEGDRYHRPAAISAERSPYQESVLYVDPAGRGQDELAFAVVKHLHGRLYLSDCQGFSGGYQGDALKRIAETAKVHKANRVLVETNFGDGMFEELLRPVMMAIYPCTVEGIHSVGQKELRIIDVLEPVMNQHRLVVDRGLILRDQKYDPARGDKGHLYQLFYQMTRLTRERGALAHDDRIEAVAGAVGWFSERMRQDEVKAAVQGKARRYEREARAWLAKAVFGGKEGKPNTLEAVVGKRRPGPSRKRVKPGRRR